MHENKDIIIESKDLPDILKQLETGIYAIPVFQRDFVWEPDNIKALWDSIYRHYPIGSFLIWETEEKLPRHRELFGISLKQSEKGNYNYILDGQQRITSLLGSIKGAKRNKSKTFLLYFDLKKALEKEKNGDNPNMEEEPIFLDEDEFEALPVEYKKFAIPVNDIVQFNTHYYKTLFKEGHEKEADFYHDLCDRLKTKYKVSIIRLNKMSIEEVCEIFTRVNQRGKKLTLVELMTAKTFKSDDNNGQEGFFLRDVLDQLNSEIDKYLNNYIEVIDETLFLRLISMNHLGMCREKDLLSLEAENIISLWEYSSEAYKQAISYLKQDLKVDSPSILPYPSMLVPLAYFFGKLEKSH